MTPQLPLDVAPVHPWLQPFPASQQVSVRGWFQHVIARDGTRDPETVLRLVTQPVTHKREWSVAPSSIQLCDTTLLALAHHRAEALSYAQQVLAGKETHG
jgi:hypothetical protein